MEVKALEWTDFGDDGAKATPFYKASYLISRWHDGRFELSVSYPGYDDKFNGDRFWPSIGLAKDAAQADWGNKVRGWLAAREREGEG